MTIWKTIILGFLSLGVIWGAGFASFAVASMTLQPADPVRTTDSIIVLTGGQARITEGLSLLARGRAQELLITGVHRHVDKDSILKKHTGQPPLPACCITIDYEANSTVTNAVAVKEWSQKHNIQSARLVTSNYHYLRALQEMHHLMPDLVILPHPVKPPEGSYEDGAMVKLLLKEYHKYIYRTAFVKSGLGQ